MLKDDLQKAGLNGTEAEIYLTLYEYRRLSAYALSRLSGIKRTTVYAAADELVKKGLANIEHGKNKRFYAVESSSSLLKYINKQEEKIIAQKKAVNSALKKMNEIPRSSPLLTPKIRIITGQNISNFLYKQSTIWEKNMKEKKEMTWWGFQDHSFVEDEKLNEWILWYWKRAPKKINLKLFSNDSEIENKMKKKRITRRKIHFWREDSTITGTQWILGDYIISIVTSEKSNYLIQTYDPIMAENIRGLYKKLWKDSEEK